MQPLRLGKIFGTLISTWRERKGARRELMVTAGKPCCIYQSSGKKGEGSFHTRKKKKKRKKSSNEQIVDERKFGEKE